MYIASYVYNYQTLRGGYAFHKEYTRNWHSQSESYISNREQVLASRLLACDDDWPSCAQTVDDQINTVMTIIW